MAFTLKLFFDKDLCRNWVKSIRDIPKSFDLDSVHHYLIESTNKMYDTHTVHAYKSLKAYKYIEEGYVCKTYIHVMLLINQYAMEHCF